MICVCVCLALFGLLALGGNILVTAAIASQVYYNYLDSIIEL